MDLRIHFDRPVSPIELEIENNSLCILSSLGKKLKNVSFSDDGRWLNINVNSETRLHPIRGSVSLPAQYGASFDVEGYKSLSLQRRKETLLEWLLDTFQVAIAYFLEETLNAKIRADLDRFSRDFIFETTFLGKWVKRGDQRARVVVYQKFQHADIHIEYKKYRSRVSCISPVLLTTSPSAFVFSNYMSVPEIVDGEWRLAS